MGGVPADSPSCRRLGGLESKGGAIVGRGPWFAEALANAAPHTGGIPLLLADRLHKETNQSRVEVCQDPSH